MAKKILIAGASGLVGSRLTELLVQKGYDVAHLGRRARSGKIASFVWNIERSEMDPHALDGVDTIINLSGAGVADKRWTASRKKDILDSRVRSTALLYHVLSKGGHRVSTLISASAVGYYGIQNDETWQTEASQPGTDFLAGVVKDWEAATDRFVTIGIRVVKLRIGIVLSMKGGALKSMALPVKWFVGAPLGSGRQYLSWIHIDDLCGMFIKAIDDAAMRGSYNAAAPLPCTNREMTLAISTILKRPMWMPAVPGFVMNLLLGEMAGMVLGGIRVSSEKIQKAGYQFQFPTLDGALRNIFQHGV